MATSSKQSSVLLIDDEPLQNEFISQQLNCRGLEVISCLNGTDALWILDTHNNHSEILILLDLEMPGIDGMEFVRYLADRGFEGGLAIISGQHLRVLESVAQLAVANRLRFLGNLIKPVEEDTLATVLDRWHKQESGKRPREFKKYEPEEIRRAIAGNEFVNHYQPKIDLRSGSVSGVESLVRWQHPSGNLVFPDQFISVAEDNGLMEDLTLTVLRDALKQVKLWQEQRIDLRLAVNVSMENLLQADFPDRVQSELERTGVDPECLTLEVTESRLMLDKRLSLDILSRLHLKQVGLSIDDFGTGHSSLVQLRGLPFDELKIDRSIVHGAANTPTLRSIFHASLSMALQLGMKVVAVGVEDRENWEFLRKSRCDEAQGYFIAKPMPASDIAAFIVDWKNRYRGFYPQ